MSVCVLYDISYQVLTIPNACTLLLKSACGYEVHVNSGRIFLVFDILNTRALLLKNAVILELKCACSATVDL